ncbi:MAG TPA: MBL fold metallo-hydrolase [Deinococcales bacterium]|nr:MBL fold metallo-hydrolase [Deinococcales bacterium]
MPKVFVLSIGDLDDPPENRLHPVAIRSEDGSLTLVDAGMPEMLPLIRHALEAQGLRLEDVRRLVITHGDLDHMGGAAELVEATGAEVIAHERELPFVTGAEILRHAPTPEDIAKMPPQMREMMLSLPPERLASINRRPVPLEVNRVVKGGDEVVPGVEVIETPGHTPGHVSLWIPSEATLVTGDAVNTRGGRVNLPPAHFTPDMASAKSSIQALAAFPATRLISYHGGEIAGDQAEALRALAGA